MVVDGKVIKISQYTPLKDRYKSYSRCGRIKGRAGESRNTQIFSVDSYVFVLYSLFKINTF